VKTDEAPRIRKSGSLESSQEADGLAAVGSVRAGGLEPSEQPVELRAQGRSPRTSSTAASVGSISIGRLARGGGGSISWW
jgi:hypothetical protein